MKGSLYAFVLFLILFVPKYVHAALPPDTFKLDLGPDVTVCAGAKFKLNPNAQPGGVYSWLGGVGLSCVNCPSPVVSGLGFGLYIYVLNWQIADTTLSDTLRITVLNAPQPKYEIAPNKSICLGDPVAIGGETIAGTFYSWSSNPPGFSSNVPNPIATPGQTTTYYLTAENGVCPVKALDSVKISVYTPPLLFIQSDTAICKNEPVRLASNPAEPGVTYSWTPAAFLDNPSAAAPVATPSVSTVYQVTATNPGCTVERQVSIVVIPLDISLSVPDTVQLCRGQEVSITANVSQPGATVKWNPLQGIQVSPDGLEAVASPQKSTAYTATVSVPGCTRTETVYIRVDSLPANLDLNIIDTSICEGSPVSLVSPAYNAANFPGIQFKWTPEQDLLTPPEAYNALVQPEDSITYTRITRLGGCADTARASIFVLPNAGLQLLVKDTTVCNGTSLLLTTAVNPGAVVQWQPAPGLTCLNCLSPQVSPPPGQTVYTVNAQLANCSSTAQVTIRAVDPPVLLLPGNVTVCSGTPVSLNSGITPGASYQWTSSLPGSDTLYVADPVVTPTQTTTYTVLASTGCPVTQQITVTVFTAVLELSPDTTICQNLPLQLIAAGSRPGSFQWNTGQTTPVITVQPAVSTTYRVVYTFTSPTGLTCQLFDSIRVTLFGATAAVDFPDDNEICRGETLLLNNNQTPGAQYSWTSNPPGFISTDPQPVVTPSVNTQYSVETTLGSCSRIDEILIIVYDTTFNVLPLETVVCAGEPLTLQAKANAPGRYVWSTGDSGATVNFPEGLNTSTFVGVQYIVGDTACILQSGSNVTVRPGFNVQLDLQPDTMAVVPGDSLRMTAIISPSQNLKTFKFTWTEDGNPLTDQDETITVRPGLQFTDEIDTVRLYQLIVVSPNGCSKTVTKEITLLPTRLAFPNAFTPNADGHNDTFGYELLQGRAVIDRLQIFNRWGQIVFESTEPNARWNGEVDGNPAPADLYYFICWYRDSENALRPFRNGQVMLLR